MRLFIQLILLFLLNSNAFAIGKFFCVDNQLSNSNRHSNELHAILATCMGSECSLPIQLAEFSRQQTNTTQCVNFDNTRMKGMRANAETNYTIYFAITNSTRNDPYTPVQCMIDFQNITQATAVVTVSGKKLICEIKTLY